MKRNCLFCLLLVFLLLFFGCTPKEEDGIPEGYIAASSMINDGFSLYVPKGWVAYRMGEFCCAYAGAIDKSSVSATYVISALTPAAYYEASEQEMAVRFQGFSTTEKNTEKTVSEKPAFVAYYTLTYNKIPYACEQTVIDAGDGILCVLTCQARTDIEQGRETSRYEEHRVEFADIRESFVLGAPVKAVEPKPEGTAPQGMKVASDKKIIGCTLSVPQNWHLLVSDGLVSASASDGYNVQLMAVSPSAGEVKTYMKALTMQYANLYENFTVVSEASAPVSVGGKKAYRYEFTYTKSGQAYYTEQYLLIHDSTFGGTVYLLTFTGKEEVTVTHTGERTQILEAFSY